MAKNLSLEPFPLKETLVPLQGNCRFLVRKRAFPRLGTVVSIRRNLWKL